MSDSARRTVRTIFQIVVAVAAGFPLLLEASGVPATTVGVGVVVAVAAAITRLMALPLVDSLLPGFLRKEGPPPEH